MLEPLFWFESAAHLQAGHVATLDGPEGKHAAMVRRMRVGEAIQLSDGCGFRARGIVSSVGASSLNAEIREATNDGEPTPAITLVQALAKGDRDEQAVQACTEAGITAVIPWQAEHSVSRWDSAKSAKNVVRWQTIATEAAKQSLRSWFPKVSEPVSTKELVQMVGDFDVVLVLEPTAELNIAPRVWASGIDLQQAKIAVVIGPEGGISPREIELFEEAGAWLVRLGAEVLRTSTAGIATVAILQNIAGNW